MTSDIDIVVPEERYTPDNYISDDQTTQAPDNIASMLTPLRLEEIAADVNRDFELDEVAFQPRKTRIEELYTLALQVAEKKSYPWDNASNVKYPLITDAALAFSAIAYPSIVKDDQVVKHKIVGSDDGEEEVKGADGQPLQEEGQPIVKNAGLKKAIGKRVSTFMSYQILNDIDDWEEDMDKILLINAIVGCSFKKVYYDPLERKSVSRLVLPQYLILDINGSGRSSELQNLYPHEIAENIAMGTFVDFEYLQSDETKEDSYNDSDGEEGAHDVDENKPHAFIEQHRRLDLDDDGYAEPYIVWMHKQSKTVVRIEARYDEDDIIEENGKIIKIAAQEQYVKFGFIPDPEGSPYDIGFGHILEDLNNTVNSSVNQMIDQGHRYTMGGGFVSTQMRIKSGDLKFKPGEYKRANTKGMTIREAVVDLNMPEPSGTLMLLIESLVKAAKDIASMSKMAGDMPANTPAITALASMEQGMQPFKAVFKRIHRSLKKEFKLLHRLNQQYLTDAEYQRILDDPNAKVETDFNTNAVDVIPMSDPEMLTNVQSFMKAQILAEYKDDPYVDPIEIRKRIMYNLNEKEVDDLIKTPAPQEPDMVSSAQVAALESQIITQKSDNQRKDKEFMLKVDQFIIDSKAKLAKATRDLAAAEAEEDGSQLAEYQHALDKEQFNFDRLTQLKQEAGNEPEGMGQVAGSTGNG